MIFSLGFRTLLVQFRPVAWGILELYLLVYIRSLVYFRIVLVQFILVTRRLYGSVYPHILEVVAIVALMKTLRSLSFHFPSDYGTCCQGKLH